MVLVLEMTLDSAYRRPPVNRSITVDGLEKNSLFKDWECAVPTATLSVTAALGLGSRKLAIKVVIDHYDLAITEYYVVRDPDIHGKLCN